jgi:hypothetical protein
MDLIYGLDKSVGSIMLKHDENIYERRVGGSICCNGLSF